MDPRWQEAREQVAQACRRMRSDRLVVGTSGNVSVRVGDVVAISPTGVDYDELTAQLVGLHRLDGTAELAPLAPSTELPLHLAVYAATDAGALVHTHSPAATAASTLVDVLPAVSYLVGLFGGPVRVSRYEPYGSQALARAAVEALADRTGCLLRNHGAVTLGDRLERAYDRALQLEWLADVWLRARAAGDPALLDEEQVSAATARLASYGPRPAAHAGGVARTTSGGRG